MSTAMPSDAPMAILMTTLMMISTINHAEAFYAIYSEDKARCTSKSIALQTCFNKYHESDSYSLTGIVYSSNYTAECSLKAPRPNLTMEAPELKENLDKIQGIYLCLRKELDKCDQMNAFFHLRHLLFTFQKALLWFNCPHTSADTDWAEEFHFTENVADEAAAPVNRESEWNDASFRNRRFFCSKDTNRMDRFADILKAYTCLECIRHSDKSVCQWSKENFASDVHLHLLRKIIRLEVFPGEVCHDLTQHIRCLESNDVVNRCSSAYFMELYKLLAFTWCSNTYSTDFSSSGLAAGYRSMFSFGIPCILCIFRIVLFE